MKFSLFERPSGDQPLFALVLLLSGVFALAFQDSLVKLMSNETSFWQFQALRSTGNIILTYLLALGAGGLGLLAPVNWRPVYLRAFFLIICMFCFFSGAPYLSFAQMAAGLYTYPLFVSLLAAPVLGETVGPWRIGALALGVAGASIILSPWDANFTVIQFLPILAGLFYALNILTLRRSCRKESPLALAFATGIMYAASGFGGILFLSVFPLPESVQQSMPFVAIGWPELTILVVGIAALSSFLNLGGNICMTRAYQTADSSWLAPLDFTYLLFAAIWGRILFDHWPTQHALIGMILIATAGVVTAWRERVTNQAILNKVPDTR